MATFDVIVSDAATAGSTLTVREGLLVTANATASGTWTLKYYPGGIISDAAIASSSATLGPLKSQASVSDGGPATDSWVVALVKTVSDSAVASSTVHLNYAPTLSDDAEASDSVTVGVKYNITVSDHAKASDTWSRAPTITVSADHATASDSVTIQFIGGASVSDSATASDSAAPLRIANASISDAAIASDAALPQMHYSITMIENVIASDFLDTSGSNTAWVLNTRTNAVTQYANFDFNSFANMGRKYLAAGPDGLYELNGASDDGADVSATIGGGYFQANGSKLAGLKGVYMGASGQGNGPAVGTWSLKLLLGNQDYMVYETVSNPGMMTSKFDIGKGINARYMAWELTNADGQDFNLDTLEFVPMMRGRRV